MEDFPIFIIMVRKHHKILTTCILQKQFLHQEALQESQVTPV